MATDIVQSLFGMTPDSYQQAQQDRANTQAMQFAKLDPFQQANYSIGRGAYGLAGAVGGALGGQDPELQRITMRQQIAGQIDYNDDASIRNAMSKLRDDPQAMLQLQKILVDQQVKRASIGKDDAAAKASLATESKINLGVAQETKLRNELSKLPPGSTEDAIRGVLVKYGDPDKVFAALTSSATRADDRTARADAAKLTNEAKVDAANVLAQSRIDAAKEAGATRLQIAQMQVQNSKDLAQLTASLKGPKLTKGQEAVDRQFGKEYAEYQAGGGSADVEKQLTQLQGVSTELGKPGNDYTGPVVGLIPAKSRSMTNPAAVAAQNRVEEVAQRNLRLVLGAQFTQVEGERLIARAYNPQMEPLENQKRVDALIKQIRTAAQVKEDAAKYFEENGTLTGWKGRMPTLSDFETAVDSAGRSKSAKPDGQWKVIK